MTLHDWIWFLSGAVIGGVVLVGFIIGNEVRRTWRTDPSIREHLKHK